MECNAPLRSYFNLLFDDNVLEQALIQEVAPQIKFLIYEIDENVH